MKGAELENNIIKELSLLNINGKSNPRLPSIKGSEFIVDLLINYPIRGVIEIKRIGPKPTILQLNNILEHFDAINKRQYLGTFTFFLVLISSLNDKVVKNLLSEHFNEDKYSHLPLNVIYVPEKILNKAKFCAEKIRENISHSAEIIPFPKKQIKDLLKSEIPKYSNIHQFEDILISLNPYITSDEEKVIIHEIEELTEEINSDHYVSASLRIGRTLEFVFYTLAQSWGVNINHLSLNIIDDLNNSNETLKSIIIDYFYSEGDEKEKKKKILMKKCTEISSKITTLGFQIDELPEPKKNDNPIYIPSILRDIRKKFSHLDKVRLIVDELKDGKSMSFLQEMRNIAAHARIGRKQKNITEKEIDIMVEHLKKVIFDLVSIAILINVKNNK